MPEPGSANGSPSLRRRKQEFSSQEDDESDDNSSKYSPEQLEAVEKYKI